jgi:multiple sugar transport system substrate-binding protein
MTGSLSRRNVLKGGAALVAAPALGRAASAQQRTRLRMAWWGGTDRARRTQEALTAYQRANPNIEVATESVGWGDYWTRLATQVAGGNAPDLIQMDYRYIFEYARRRALKPLDEFMPDPLNIRDFGQANIDTGKVDNQVFGVSMGVNSTAIFYDKTTLERLQIQPPSHTTTWEQFAALTTEITRKAARRGYFGTQDCGFAEQTLEVWVRQRGKLLYNAEGKLGFERDDLAEYFDYWDRLRRAGGAVAGDIQALDRRSTETDMLVMGRAAITFQNSNQLVAWQAVVQNRLGMTMMPQGQRPGQYYKPSMLMSMSASTQQAREVAKVINFLSTSPEAAATLGVERGVPPSAAMRAALLPNADELAKAQIDYIALMADRVSPLPLPPPAGAGEIEQQLLRRTYESISVGGTRVPDAATAFMTEARRILDRG